MTNQPNSSPHPDEIFGVRMNAGLTQKQAAELVHSSLRSWQNWESDPNSTEHRRMHPGLWELFLIKTGLNTNL